MSQAGEIDVVGTHPEIPTEFIADVGTAVPIANQLELLGEVVANGVVPFQSVASGNTVTYQVQLSNEIAATDATKVGLSAFNSASFDVDANGFVNLLGGGVAATNIDVDAHTAPGTDPVVPNGMGNVVFTGGQVASGTVGANVIRSYSGAANTVAIEIQRTTSAASADSTKNGVAHFNSTEFSVDANGFVSLAGGGLAIDSIAVQTGTSPIVPTAAGLVTINGAVVAAGTNPIRSNGTGANTLAMEVQIAQATAATDATRIGLAAFDSAAFAVDANGFVTLAGGGLAIDSFQPDSGTNPVVPTAGGLVVMAGSGSITTVGSLNTLTTQLTGLTNHAVLVGAGTTTITKLAVGTNGQVLIGATGADPAFATLTSSDSSITFTTGANTLSLQVAGGTTVGKTITGNSGGALSPTAGNWNILGASTAAGTSPVTTSGAASTLTVNVQKAQAIAATDATKVGLANFNSAQFSVDANGFVSASTTGIATTITGDSGGALSPSSNNWNILGGPGVTTSGSGSTLTINSVVFTDQAGSTSVTSDSGSFATSAITLTLPASPAQGEICEFVATSAAALIVDAPSTHLIRIGNAVSSAGGTATSGSLAGDALVLRYRSSNTTWYATSVIGNWTTA